jgi:phosphoribosylpyrophosphate synthetase
MQKLTINDFIIIDTFGGLEYKIRLNIPEKEFLSLLKNTNELMLDCDKSRDWSIELINCVGAYISQYLSSWHTLVLNMPYLKYSRQERKTDDDCDQLTPYLHSILYFNTIETIYLHNNNYKHKTKKIVNTAVKSSGSLGFVLLADSGLLSRYEEVCNLLCDAYDIMHGKPQYFNKTRDGANIITTLPDNFTQFLEDMKSEPNAKITIIDDIIGGGQTMINAINLLKEYVSIENIHIGVIYVMSDYSIKKLMEAGIKKENIKFIHKVII